jgi:hypothetical protein
MINEDIIKDIVSSMDFGRLREVFWMGSIEKNTMTLVHGLCGRLRRPFAPV